MIRPGISFHLDTADPQHHTDIMIAGKDFYKEYQVNVIAGEKALSLDCAKKTITTETKRELCYDKLLIAIGATSSLPPIPGIGLKNMNLRVQFRCFFAGPRSWFQRVSQI